MSRRKQGTGTVMEPVAAEPTQAPPGEIAQPPGNASLLWHLPFARGSVPPAKQTAAAKAAVKDSRTVRELIDQFLKQLGDRPDADILSCQARSETPTATEYMRQVPPERQGVLNLNLRVVYQLG